MEKNHYFDGDGVYLSSSYANPGTTPPANAVRTPPPAFGEGFRPVWDRERGAWLPGKSRLYLTSSGTLHRAGCRYTSAPGRWIGERETPAGAKPCRHCKPEIGEE